MWANTAPLLRQLALLAGLLLASAQSNATLTNWNDIDLNASGDFIAMDYGTINGDTWFSMQWNAGVDNSLGALGIDTVFYNCEGCDSLSNTQGDDALNFGGVKAVWENGIGGTGTDVTSSWTTNYAGQTSGGGFGSFFSRKDLDPASHSGVAPDTLFFVLNDHVTFVGNDNGSTFAAHVRYEENCSGWVSDGTTNAQDSGSCGSTSVPEPSSFLLMSIALLGMVIKSRRH